MNKGRGDVYSRVYVSSEKKEGKKNIVSFLFVVSVC